jgi:hypothetical protein
MPTHRDNCAQHRHRIREARAIGGTQADPEKTHLADRAGGKGFGPAEPSARSNILGVRFPSARDQKIHVEQVAQGSSSSSALTLSVVIGGEPGAATSTGRPNFPCLSAAARRCCRCRTNLRPSSLISTLSPGRKFRALRKRAGITSCPLVESMEVLISEVLHVLLLAPRGPAARRRCNDRAFSGVHR